MQFLGGAQDLRKFINNIISMNAGYCGVAYGIPGIGKKSSLMDITGVNISNINDNNINDIINASYAHYISVNVIPIQSINTYYYIKDRINPNAITVCILDSFAHFDNLFYIRPLTTYEICEIIKLHQISTRANIFAISSIGCGSPGIVLNLLNSLDTALQIYNTIIYHSATNHQIDNYQNAVYWLINLLHRSIKYKINNDILPVIDLEMQCFEYIDKKFSLYNINYILSQHIKFLNNENYAIIKHEDIFRSIIAHLNTV